MQVLTDLHTVIEDHQNKIDEKDRLQPFFVISGPLSSPEKYYTVLGNVKYSFQSPIEALDIALKICTTYKVPYTKDVISVWLLMQKLLLNITLPKEKLPMATKKALDFFEKEN